MAALLDGIARQEGRTLLVMGHGTEDTADETYARLRARLTERVKLACVEGKYALDGEVKTRMKWSIRTVFAKLIGITPEYSLGDKITAWGIFFYSIVYQFILAFVLVFVWNCFWRWPAFLQVSAAVCSEQKPPPDSQRI